MNFYAHVLRQFVALFLSLARLGIFPHFSNENYGKLCIVVLGVLWVMSATSDGIRKGFVATGRHITLSCILHNATEANTKHHNKLIT